MTEQEQEIERLRDLLAQTQKENNVLSARVRELEDSVTCLEQGTDSVVEDIRYSISFLEKYLKK